MILLLVVTAAIAAFSTAGAHPGGLGADGCHANQTTAERHCHRAEPRGLSGKSFAAKPSTRSYLVSRVIDGDTIQLDNGERVRLIGVDTPETVHPTKPVEAFGKEASAFTRGMVEGIRVRLEYDQANAAKGHRDRYGRLLAYVMLPDGRLLNREIIAQGYGHAYVKYPFDARRMEEFRAAERAARREGRGLWAE